MRSIPREVKFDLLRDDFFTSAAGAAPASSAPASPLASLFGLDNKNETMPAQPSGQSAEIASVHRASMMTAVDASKPLYTDRNQINGQINFNTALVQQARRQTDMMAKTSGLLNNNVMAGTSLAKTTAGSTLGFAAGLAIPGVPMGVSVALAVAPVLKAWISGSGTFGGPEMKSAFAVADRSPRKGARAPSREGYTSGTSQTQATDSFWRQMSSTPGVADIKSRAESVNEFFNNSCFVLGPHAARKMTASIDRLDRQTREARTAFDRRGAQGFVAGGDQGIDLVKSHELEQAPVMKVNDNRRSITVFSNMA